MNRVRSKDGTSLAYDRLGDGPPVILVGGAFSYRAFPKMIELAELLARRFTVINYDRRGRGESGDTAPYAVARELEDLEALIADAGGSSSIWGWSSGGALALRAAAAGLSLDKVAVYETPFMVDRDGHLPPADFAQRLRELVDKDERSAAVRYYMTAGMGIPRPIVAAMRLAPFWKKLKEVAHTLPYDWAVMGDTMAGKPLSQDEWGGIVQPTLVMAGEKSPQELRKAATALASVLPNAQHRVLEGQSHNPKMKVLVAALTDFLADPGARRPEPRAAANG